MGGSVSNLKVGLPVARLASAQGSSEQCPQGDGDEQAPRGNFDDFPHSILVEKHLVDCWAELSLRPLLL